MRTDKKKEKEYLVLGDNNFWYSTFRASTSQEIDDMLKEVKEGIKDNDYENETVIPSMLYVYEAKEVKKVNINIQKG